MKENSTDTMEKSLQKLSRGLRFSLGLNVLVIFVLFCFVFPACSSGSSNSIVGGSTSFNYNAPAPAPVVGIDQPLKVLAANVVFRTSGVKRDDVSETKVYADNVVLDNTGTSLTSTNVQDAFAETQPDLATILPGTWDVKYYCGDTIETGYITFNTDGSFECDRPGSKLLTSSWMPSSNPSPVYEIIDGIIRYSYEIDNHIEIKRVCETTTLTKIKENNLELVSPGNYTAKATKRQ